MLEIEVGTDYQGTVVEMLGRRRGQMRDMHYRDDGSVHYVYYVPTRGLLGFRQQFLTATRGQGIMNSLFAGYEPLMGEIDTRESGSLIASETGTATTYGLYAAQDRGQLFVLPGQEVYEGMIVGQHTRDNDLEVNICRKKHLTNFRNNLGEDTLRLEAPRVLSLDDAIEYIGDDELVEVTPRGWRLRKKVLVLMSGASSRSAAIWPFHKTFILSSALNLPLTYPLYLSGILKGIRLPSYIHSYTCSVK